MGGWNSEPFAADSGLHVSVYELVPASAPSSTTPKSRKFRLKLAKRKGGLTRIR
jgi:hypothetical protein